MKKILMTALLFLGLYTTVNAAILRGHSPFGDINIEVNDGVPPKEVIMPSATTMSYPFPVYYDDGERIGSFPVFLLMIVQL